VGHDGLEPSTNGLRSLDERRDPAFSEGFREVDATVHDARRDCGSIVMGRARAIADLAARIGEAAMAGDLGLARILGRALRELLREDSEGRAD